MSRNNRFGSGSTVGRRTPTVNRRQVRMREQVARDDLIELAPTVARQYEGPRLTLGLPISSGLHWTAVDLADGQDSAAFVTLDSMGSHPRVIAEDRESAALQARMRDAATSTRELATSLRELARGLPDFDPNELMLLSHLLGNSEPESSDAPTDAQRHAILSAPDILIRQSVQRGDPTAAATGSTRTPTSDEIRRTYQDLRVAAAGVPPMQLRREGTVPTYTATRAEYLRCRTEFDRNGSAVYIYERSSDQITWDRILSSDTGPGHASLALMNGQGFQVIAGDTIRLGGGVRMHRGGEAVLPTSNPTPQPENFQSRVMQDFRNLLARAVGYVNDVSGYRIGDTTVMEVQDAVASLIMLYGTNDLLQYVERQDMAAILWLMRGAPQSIGSFLESAYQQCLTLRQRQRDSRDGRRLARAEAGGISITISTPRLSPAVMEEMQRMILEPGILGRIRHPDGSFSTRQLKARNPSMHPDAGKTIPQPRRIARSIGGHDVEKVRQPNGSVVECATGQETTEVRKSKLSLRAIRNQPTKENGE